MRKLQKFLFLSSKLLGTSSEVQTMHRSELCDLQDALETRKVEGHQRKEMESDTCKDVRPI